MFEKCYCPYCGHPLTDCCGCEFEIADYEREMREELEERQFRDAWQQDVIDMYRFER